MSVYGGRVDVSNPREGHLDDGRNAYDERVMEARRRWAEAPVSDYEALDDQGRKWRHRESGTVFVSFSGAPLLSSPESLRGYDRLVVAGGRLFVLRPASYQAELRGPEQRVYSQRIGPGSPGPALRQDLRIS
jgi:hypothetical protein